MKTLMIYIQAIIWTIITMKASAQKTGFLCYSNVDQTPTFKSVIKNVSMVAKALRISAIECALLCKARSCISFAYDPATQQCFTKNVNVGQTGLLCGTAVHQAREHCKVIGEAYVAYGGRKYDPLQCVCGTYEKGGGWAKQTSTTSYNCIDILAPGLFLQCYLGLFIHARFARMFCLPAHSNFSR